MYLTNFIMVTDSYNLLLQTTQTLKRKVLGTLTNSVAPPSLAIKLHLYIRPKHFDGLNHDQVDFCYFF